jgi:hypothetical protein
MRLSSGLGKRWKVERALNILRFSSKASRKLEKIGFLSVVPTGKQKTLKLI